MVGIVALAAIVIVALHRPTPAASTGQALRLDPGTRHGRPHAGGAGSRMAIAIAAGDYSTCALVKPTVVECWGDNGYGQLGNGDKTGVSVPAQVHLGRPAIAIAAGGSHACAVLDNHTVDCWGANLHGELGSGTRDDSPSPVPVTGIHDAVALAAGAAHTCALRSSGGVACWGANGNGQLGDGTTTDRATPAAVTGLTSPVRAVAAGLAHTCALLVGGSVECWGSDANGELGNGTTVDRPTPVAVSGLAGPATAVDAGDAHTCALLADGKVQCWGWNIEGQLGNGGGTDSPTPVDVSPLGPATAIAAGGSHTCVLLKTGAVDCFGADLYGQLGNGTTSDSATPVAVSGLENGVAAITAGLYHSCAILDGGSATCWGWNEQGQLGDGTRTTSPTPVNVVRLGLAPDGSGLVDVNPGAVSASAAHVTVAFTYTVAAGGMHDGTLAITVPLGWSLPSARPKAPGFAGATVGRTTIAGRTITVAGLTLAAGAKVVVVYGSTTGGGPGARPARAGAPAWTVFQQSSSSGNLSRLPRSPVIHILSADGSGLLAARTTNVPNGATGRTLAFDFAAAPGGVDGGTLTLAVPGGWSPPSTSPGAPGYVRASQGGVAVSGRTVSVIGITLAGAQRLQIVYGDRSHGGPGARAPSAAVGAETWAAELRASPAGQLVPLAASPQVNILAPDGSGRVSVSQDVVANGQSGVQLTFSYVAENGGVRSGSLAVTVPRGWSAPSTAPGDPGYVTSSVKGIQVAGRTIVVPLSGGASSNVQVTYGAGTGAQAPATNVGPQDWQTRERSTAVGRLRALGQQPQVTVLSHDGSGRLLRASGRSLPGSRGNTVVFLYQAAPGGLQDGTLTLTVPDGWSAPSTRARDAGYVVATAGSVSTSGRTITLSHVSLPTSGTLTVVYGSRSGRGPGARAPASPGPAVWPAAEASTATGKLATLR